MPQPVLNIAIVGAGIAGAATAVTLARAGHAVTVFERAPVLRPVGAGLLLQPIGQAALARMALLDEVTAEAEPIDRLHARMSGGRDLIHLRYDETAPGRCAWGVHRSDLFAPLHRAAGLAGARFALGTDITATHHVADRVELFDGAGGRHGPFDLVIAADGARSVLRGDCGLRKFVWRYRPSALWATGRCAGVRGKLLQVTRGTRKLCGLLPLGDGRCSLFWGLTGKAAKDEMLRRGFDAWRQECVALCPEAQEVFESVTSFDQATLTPFHHVWMPRWYDRRVLFLGDAAHAMSPHFGQGANLALLDAVALADCLAGCEGDLPEAARRFTERRAAHVRLYATLSLLLTPFFQGGGVVKGMGRNVALPWMTRVPWLRRRMIRTMGGERGSITGASLRV